jgi:hypothetical protein
MGQAARQSTLRTLGAHTHTRNVPQPGCPAGPQRLDERTRTRATEPVRRAVRRISWNSPSHSHAIAMVSRISNAKRAASQGSVYTSRRTVCSRYSTCVCQREAWTSERRGHSVDAPSIGEPMAETGCKSAMPMISPYTFQATAHRDEAAIGEGKLHVKEAKNAQSRIVGHKRGFQSLL